MLVFARVPTMGFSLGPVVQAVTGKAPTAAPGAGVGAGAAVRAIDTALGIKPQPLPGGLTGRAVEAVKGYVAQTPPPPPPISQATKGAIVDQSGRVSVASGSSVPANPATPSLPQNGPANCSSSSVWDPVTRSCKPRPLPACAAGMVRNADGICARPPAANTALPAPSSSHQTPETTPSSPGSPATDGGTAAGPSSPIVTGSGPGTGTGGGGGTSVLPVGPSQPPADALGGGGSVTYDASGAPVAADASGLPFGLTPTKIAIGVGAALAGWYLLKHGGGKKGR